jgi:hypothetical protein
VTYSKFTLSRAVADFNLTVQEGPGIFQGIAPMVQGGQNQKAMPQ